MNEVTDQFRWRAALMTENFPAYGPSAYTRAFLYERLSLWTRHSAAAGRSLGERLRSLDWESAARSGQRSRS